MYKKSILEIAIKFNKGKMRKCFTSRALLGNQVSGIFTYPVARRQDIYISTGLRSNQCVCVCVCTHVHAKEHVHIHASSQNIEEIYLKKKMKEDKIKARITWTANEKLMGRNKWNLTLHESKKKTTIKNQQLEITNETALCCTWLLWFKFDFGFCDKINESRVLMESYLWGYCTFIHWELLAISCTFIHWESSCNPG